MDHSDSLLPKQVFLVTMPGQIDQTANHGQIALGNIVTMPDILVERDGPVGIVTMNRPQAMNALSGALRAALSKAMTDLDADPAIRAIVLTGAGERAFTAGLDLKELGADDKAIEAANATSAEQNPVLAIEGCAKPVIAAINGVAITGGFELALACDILLASENARFADTHARIGVMPGWGLSQKLSRLIGLHRAKELSLSGNFIGAEKALEWGLVNRVVPAADLRPQAIALARDIAQVSSEFVCQYKQLIDDGYRLALGPALELEAERSRAVNSRLNPDDLERRRGDVLARGRQQ